MTVPPCSHSQLRELAYRASDGLEVTLFWRPDSHELKVCVCDHKDGAYFEIRPDPDQALLVFYHPYAYVAHCDVHYEDERRPHRGRAWRRRGTRIRWSRSSAS